MYVFCVLVWGVVYCTVIVTLRSECSQLALRVVHGPIVIVR